MCVCVCQNLQYFISFLMVSDFFCRCKEEEILGFEYFERKRNDYILFMSSFHLFAITLLFVVGSEYFLLSLPKLLMEN